MFKNLRIILYDYVTFVPELLINYGNCIIFLSRVQNLFSFDISTA